MVEFKDEDPESDVGSDSSIDSNSANLIEDLNRITEMIADGEPLTDDDVQTVLMAIQLIQ